MRTAFVVILLFAFVAPLAVAADGNAPSKNPQAVRLYQEGMRLQENRRTYEALQKWREATVADPNMALAWAMLSTLEPSSEVARAAREKARYLIENQPQSGADDLLIRWIVSRSESDLMYSIQVANDLTTKHPDQKRILWAVGSWYGFQMRQYDRDAEMQEAALKLDPNYGPALDELGFAYAHLQQFDRAVEMVKRYAELTPNEANTQASLAEVLRLAGRYDEALEHYRLALKILPSFDSAQLGLGDTYASMGDQKRAREEYGKCSASGLVSTRLNCRKMSIYTYIREQNNEQAVKSLMEFSGQMHSVKRISLELESLIALGLVSKSADSALGYLDQALEAAKSTRALPKSDRDETIARVLAHKVRIASASGQAEAARKAQAELETFASASRDPYVDAALHGARGASLFAQKKFEGAIAELLDDRGDANSQLLLWRSYEQVGDHVNAALTRKSIIARHSMDIDYCLVQLEMKAS